MFSDTNSTLILVKSGDAVAGAMVVGVLVVALVVLSSLQMPKKAHGSIRSLGTPPKAKVRLAIRTSGIFIVR